MLLHMKSGVCYLVLETQHHIMTNLDPPVRVKIESQYSDMGFSEEKVDHTICIQGKFAY